MLSIKNNRFVVITAGVLFILLIALFALSGVAEAQVSTEEINETNTITMTDTNTDSERIEELEQELIKLQNQVNILELQVKNLNNIQKTEVSTEKEVSTTTIDATNKEEKSSTNINSNNPVVKTQTKTDVPAEKPIEETKKITEVNRIITEASGLTASQIDLVLNYVLTVKYNKTDSKLLNMGEALKKIEDEYNVNALFAIAVSCYETGWGCCGVANQNNMFAFAGNNGYITYSSVEDSIYAFGKVMRENYFNSGLSTINDISGKYCPVNKSTWTDNISWFMNYFCDIADTILQN